MALVTIGPNAGKNILKQLEGATVVANFIFYQLY